MPGEISQRAQNILNYAEELRKLSTGNRENYAAKKNEILSKIDDECSKIYGFLNIENKDVLKNPPVLPKPQTVSPKEKKPVEIKPEIPAQVSAQQEAPEFFIKNLSKAQKKIIIKNFNLNYSEIDAFVKLQKAKQKGKKKDKKKLESKIYTVYEPSEIGKFANKYMKKYADNLVTKYPKFFEPMFIQFKMVEMEMLSRSYVAMMLFFTILSLPGIFLFFLALNFSFNLSVLAILGIAILGTIATFFGFYFYPASLIGGRKGKIKLELPFALVHMSAVAGSGATPISIFELIAESHEYPELRKEVKKIMNYVNLFGYNLTNALRGVATTTPSPEFKELLSGMVSTIESGGDLKDYLKEKSMEALNTYKLDRRKQVEALSTYSEIYTAILIASPLLLLVTLAIINSIGGSFGGLGVTTIAWIGIGGVLPLLNVGFMLFINMSQKGL